MLQENSPLNRLEQAVAAAERADKRLLEKPLNDLVTEIKVRGLIAKMVLVTARQTMRAVEAEAVPVGLPKAGAVAVMPPRACDEPRILPVPTEAKAVETVPVVVPKRKPPKKPLGPNNKIARQQEEMREAALETMPSVKKSRYSKKEAAWILGMSVALWNTASVIVKSE